jgi:Protein of unknown function (DUF3037)
MAAVSYYSVVRYVPDPIRDERINIGVVVTGESGEFAGAKFTHDLQRAKSFGAEDPGFLKNFSKMLEDLTVQPQLRLELEKEPSWDLATVRMVHEQWGNAIQFGEPRAALESDPSKLLDEVFARYVTGTRRRDQRVKDRRWVAAQGILRLRASAKERFPRIDVDQIVKRSHEVTGKFDAHTFPIFLQRNGTAHAIEAISFEVDDSDRLAREVDATAWAIDDVRKTRPELPISVLVLEKAKSSHFQRAERLYKALDAPIVRSADVDEWAHQAVRALGETTAAHR